MTWSCGWPAPAKLNLFLHILGRRTDGYHDLQTLFQFIDHGDSLAFRLRDDDRIVRAFGAHSVALEEDIVVRAAQRLRAMGSAGPGVDIAISKHIPLGGGLGGGSSDAATTLVALNHLWCLRLSIDRLAEIALELGADVPVFVRGYAAWAEGVGEQLAPAEPAEPWYLVVSPPVAVSTAEVFGFAELTRDCPPITIRAFLAGEVGNVCEAPVRRRFPEVAAALDWLADRGATARMSGTGACVFGAFSSETEARESLAAMPEGRWRGFVARGCNRSPLALRMEALK